MSRTCGYMGPVEQNAFPGTRTDNQGRHGDQVDATVSKLSDNNGEQYHKSANRISCWPHIGERWEPAA